MSRYKPKLDHYSLVWSGSLENGVTTHLFSSLVNIQNYEETHLRPQKKIFLANYHSYYSYRDNQNLMHPSGGTAILIKNNIPHHELIPPTLQYVEASVVVLDLKDSDPITFTSIYIPPTSNNYLFTFDLEKLLQINPNQVICGDFNAHHVNWGCNYNNTRGVTLEHFVNNTGIEILAPSTPTRFGQNSASTIDLAIVQDFLFPYDIQSLPELSSDHNPILLNFYFKFSMPNITGNTKINWNKFRNHLANCNIPNPIEIKSPADIDSFVESYENAIMEAKIAASNPITNNQSYIDPRIRKLNNERNFARKMAQKYRTPVLRSIANNLNKQINTLNDKIENENYVNTLINVNTDDGSFWNFVRPFNRKIHKIPTLNGPANIAQTDKEKANCLADSLEKQFQLNNVHHTETVNLVNNTVKEFFNNAPHKFNDIKPIDPTEITNYIKKLNKKKSPGIDGINNKTIQNLPNQYIDFLAKLIENIMIFGYFPTRWKTATVIPILKPGKDPTLPDSYRSSEEKRVLAHRGPGAPLPSRLSSPPDFQFR
ncbi:RNA-directed DNA polymerase from mobile element jockey [Araneus ventricosus]|uniref:RNA-directed DNA polymerase from mobile element jockey n=1 Tax=Araneus ventricosus TaxID=182803 RepID=A0A4Y2VRI2_ARAVE|nr:RNA-directed DNA polymerase from mobile element jockey [Araneus ventricosus]